MNTKVILNKDVSTLGEEGDVKEVAKGYARNYLFPRGIALPYTKRILELFEARKEEIAERKKLKRQDASSIKERLEALELAITMPAGANGKLYGAVTSLSVMEELEKLGFQIERKRIEIPGNTIKKVGKYKFIVKLYGNTSAELFINITAQEEKHTPKESPAKEKRKRWHEARQEDENGDAPAEAVSSTKAEAGGSVPAGTEENSAAE
ncbi:MAG: 50S ribosomal protein L9 [Spirochaetaceae bacterium]|jgi:large subunit ribosomal protein L9|nr:50S ribosomal protein L9 [Spirochaetaceae bacterium]